MEDHTVLILTTTTAESKKLVDSLWVVAPTRPGRFPVLVFLHGFGLAPTEYLSLLRGIAVEGYVVMAPSLYPAGKEDENCSEEHFFLR